MTSFQQNSISGSAVHVFSSGSIGGTATASYQGAPVNDLATCILKTRRRKFPHLSDFFLPLSFRLFERQDDLTFQYLKIK